MSHINATYDEAGKTLAVTYRGETRVFPARDLGACVLATNVFATKFKTGAKLWPAEVALWKKSGKAAVQQGGFSNKGGATQLVGWWNPGSNVNSQYRGRR